MISIDLGAYSKKLRKEYLVPSSGWIGDVVIPVSNLTGIWDIFLVSAIFILSWTIIRLSDRVVALILARAFDTSIPLQHQLNPNAQALHSKHCEGYWPVWYVATAVEVAAYFLFHPDLFTLVTCIKTTAMIVWWHGRSVDGSFWASVSRAASTTSQAPRERSTKQNEWNDTLKAKGYTSKARGEMLRKLNKEPSEGREALVKKWEKADAKQLQTRNETYERMATERAQAGA